MELGPRKVEKGSVGGMAARSSPAGEVPSWQEFWWLTRDHLPSSGRHTPWFNVTLVLNFLLASKGKYCVLEAYPTNSLQYKIGKLNIT